MLGFPIVAAVVTVSNVVPRYDTVGRMVNAHDGVLVQLPTAPGSTEQLFYQYGTVYKNCSQAGPICDGVCGYLGNLFAVYSSPDLATWTLVSDNVLPSLARDNGRVSYWEANVAFNALTRMYVMVYWSGHFGFVNSSIAVATSASPGGPFIDAPPIIAAGASVVSDTVALFVDNDGTGYVRYNTIDLPKRHVVERLTADWLSTSGRSAVIFEKPDFPWYDGGGMFERGGTYYVMLSFDCCFCQWGSDALVFTAPSPLGPWAPQAAAAPLPAVADTGACNLTGQWSGVLSGQPVGAPALQLVQDASSTVSVTGAVATEGVFYAQNSSLVFPSFPGHGTLVGRVRAYNGTGGACTEVAWLDFSPPGSFWCLYDAMRGGCAAMPVPPANWTNEVNLCSTGEQPPSHVETMHINPCSQDDVDGANYTVPAQQFSVSVLRNVSGGATYLFNGEHFRSASDGLKAHDLQAWIPLSFGPGGAVLPMAWVDAFDVWL